MARLKPRQTRGRANACRSGETPFAARRALGIARESRQGYSVGETEPTRVTFQMDTRG